MIIIVCVCVCVKKLIQMNVHMFCSIVVFADDDDDDDDDDIMTISVIRDNGQQISLANSGIVNMIIDKIATSL